MELRGRQALVELTSLDELSFPTSSNARLKYTCLCASAHYVAVGSSAGSVYLFSRYAAKQRRSASSVPVQVISPAPAPSAAAPTPALPVTLLALSPDERHLAMATAGGTLKVLRLSGAQPSLLLSADLHAPAQLTALAFGPSSALLFAGDSVGRLSLSTLNKRNLFRAPTELLHQLDSPICQIDAAEGKILVSTQSRTYLCHLSSSSLVQVGRKLRQSPMGACFFPGPGDKGKAAQAEQIFSARPGGRLWAADAKGCVRSTYNLGQLESLPRLPLFSYREAEPKTGAGEGGALAFTTLERLSSEFLVSVCGSSLSVVEPVEGSVALLCELGVAPEAVSVSGRDVFLLAQGAIRKLSLFPLPKAVEKLHWRQCFAQAAVLALHGAPADGRLPWKPDLLGGILNGLNGLARTAETEAGRLSRERAEELSEQLMVLFQRARSEALIGGPAGKPPKGGGAVRLPSGVHRVLKVMENSGYDDDFTFRAPSPLRKPKRSQELSGPNLDGLDLSGTASPVRKRDLSRSRSQNSLLDAEDEEEPTSSSSEVIGRSSAYSVLQPPTDVEVAKVGLCPEFVSHLEVVPATSVLSNLKERKQKVVDSVSRMGGSGRGLGGEAGPPPIPSLSFEEAIVAAGAESLPPLPVLPALPTVITPKHRLLTNHRKKTRHSANGNSAPKDANDNDGIVWRTRAGRFPKEAGQRDGASAVSAEFSQVVSGLTAGLAHRCLACGLHRSWLLAAELARDGVQRTLPPALPRHPGSLPTSLQDWKELFKKRKLLLLTGATHAPCGSCASFFSRLAERPRPSVTSAVASKGDALSAVRSHLVSTVGRLPPSELLAETAAERVVEVVVETEESPVPEALPADVWEAREESPESGGSWGEWSVEGWVAGVPAAALLALLLSTQGTSALGQLREELPMDPDSWRLLATWQGPREPLPLRAGLVRALYEDLLGLELGEGAAGRDRDGSRKAHEVDLSSACPLCTLPLAAMVVSEGPRRLLRFPCGHVFHQVCAASAQQCPLCPRSPALAQHSNPSD